MTIENKRAQTSSFEVQCFRFLILCKSICNSKFGQSFLVAILFKVAILFLVTILFIEATLFSNSIYSRLFKLHCVRDIFKGWTHSPHRYAFVYCGSLGRFNSAPQNSIVGVMQRDDRTGHNGLVTEEEFLIKHQSATHNR